MRDSVRIVLVGDEKVGKTSIIEVLITERFTETVQPVLPVLVVPREVTPENVHVSIVDTPGEASQVAKVDEQLNQADVVVLVYAVDDQLSASRVLNHWLPKFRSMDLSVPVVLVGNKIDTRGQVSDPTAAAKMEAFIKPIMDRFREVDVCIECSAKSLSNISEVFYFAQKAVLYPTGPVYDVETHQLKPKAVTALRRIFKICDKDGDGGLNDTELNDFQHMCFGVRLQAQELEGVKRVVKENNPATGLRPDDSLSVDGFVYLHTLFVQKGRLETTWIVLRKFNYDDELRLKVDAKLLPKLADDQVIELSDTGKSFLKNIFDAADKDNDGLISIDHLNGIFAECADGPFAERKLKNADSQLVRTVVSPNGEFYNLEAFLARWAILLVSNAEEAVRCLMYLGLGENDLSNAVKVSKAKRKDRAARTVSRDTIQIGVFGAEGALKADVVRGLVKLEPRWLDEQGIVSAAQLSDAEGMSKTLVMKYLNSAEEAALMNGSSSWDSLDIVCIVFDVASTDSLAKGLEVYENIAARKRALAAEKAELKVPIVFVGAFADNADEEGLGEDADAEPHALTMADDFCIQNALPTPSRVSIADGDYGRLYDDLLGVATYPHVACPDYYEGDEATGETAFSALLKITAGTAALGLTAYAAKKVYDYYMSKPSSSS